MHLSGSRASETDGDPGGDGGSHHGEWPIGNAWLPCSARKRWPTATASSGDVQAVRDLPQRIGVHQTGSTPSSPTFASEDWHAWLIADLACDRLRESETASERAAGHVSPITGTSPVSAYEWLGLGVTPHPRQEVELIADSNVVDPTNQTLRKDHRTKGRYSYEQLTKQVP